MPHLSEPIETRPLPVKWKSTLGLYLDISKKNTGYAVMLGMNLLHYGEKSFQKAKSDGHMLHEFEEWITDLLDTGEFDLIATEYAAFQKGRANELWHNLAAILKKVAYARGLRVAKVYASQIKFHAAGHSKADKAQIVKRVNRIHELELTSDDIADAIGCGHACAGLIDDGTLKWL